MSKLVSNYSSNGTSQTDEYGTFLGLSRLLGGSGVIQGMAVAANTTPAMNVYVQPGTALIGTGTSPTNYSYFVGVDTSGQGELVSIGTSTTSPRIDYIVAYVNKSQVASTSSVNNTNNVLMFADVQGTPAGSPTAPTVAQIQSTIGAANPYIILAQIAVGANVTQITNSNITDLRTWAQVPLQNGATTTLGFAQITSNFSTSSTSQVQVTGLTATVTIPAGGRRVHVMAYSSAVYNSSASTGVNLSLWDGAVGSGTQIGYSTFFESVAGTSFTMICHAYVTPAAGSKTYNVSMSVSGGTGTMALNPNQPAFILVELV